MWLYIHWIVISKMKTQFDHIHCICFCHSLLFWQFMYKWLNSCLKSQQCMAKTFAVNIIKLCFHFGYLLFQLFQNYQFYLRLCLHIFTWTYCTTPSNRLEKHWRWSPCMTKLWRCMKRMRLWMKRQFLLDMKKFAELCKFSLHVDVIHIHVILEHQRHTY